jgi:Ca2+-binding RTX toxin-like protein
LYISPTKCGIGDGSSWQNSAGLSDLSSMIAKAGPGGTVLLRADQGAYHTTGQISITDGGTEGSPVTVRGVDGAGNPMKAEIVGTRDEVVTATSTPGLEVFRLLDGADNLSFENLSFANQGNGCFRIGADIANLSIQHVDADNVMRFIENYASGTRTSATVDGLVVRDVDVTGFSRGVIRLGYDSHDIVLEDITGDSEGQNADDWATGVALEGTVHDVTIRGVAMSNSFDDSTSYWNGDGFAAEWQTYDITFENTLASGNTDGGYDIKSDNVTMINAVAEGNKRNFRFWGDNVTVIDSTSLDPHTQGGSGSQDHVFLADGATVIIINSTIADSDPDTIGFDLGENATLTLQDTTVSLSPAAQYVLTRTNSVFNVIVSAPDLIESSGTFSLAGRPEHNLTLTGSANIDGIGNELANVIRGNTGHNALQGAAGNDTLAGHAGNDRLDGGAGSDTASYVGSSAAIRVSLAVTTAQDTGGNGMDTVVAIENLAGSAHDDLLTGNAGNNQLSGGDGNDTLDGGLGTDVLAGGRGNDVYRVNAAADDVRELAGEGTDEIRSTLSSSLMTLADIENLTLLGTSAINATGNARNNLLIGNAAANLIDGGSGADTMAGGKGNDTYVVGSAGDIVTEAAAEGTDTVRSSLASHTLHGNVEKLVLLPGGIAGTGNDLANTLIGNAADNILDGRIGRDTLIGGTGDDVYLVDDVRDVVTESLGAGVDTVKSTAPSYSLGAGVNNLILLGTGNTSGTGNSLGNRLTGNAGNNNLNGSTGDDTVTGGGGGDQIDVYSGNDLVCHTAILDGHDVIIGFDGRATGGQDRLDLDTLFDSLGVATANRAGRVSVVDAGTSVDIRVNADGSAGNGFELTVATLKTADTITVGEDVIIAT